VKHSKAAQNGERASKINEWPQRKSGGKERRRKRKPLEHFPTAIVAIVRQHFCENIHLAKIEEIL